MVVSDNFIHVDADQNANLRDFFEMRAEREIARRTQIADQSVKSLDVRIVTKNALQLGE